MVDHSVGSRQRKKSTLGGIPEGMARSIPIDLHACCKPGAVRRSAVHVDCLDFGNYLWHSAPAVRRPEELWQILNDGDSTEYRHQSLTGLPGDAIISTPGRRDCFPDN